MFEFVESFDEEMRKRLADIEANIKTKSYSVFVTMQSYLEYTCKTIEKKEDKAFGVGKRNVLGHYLRDYKFTQFVSNNIGFSNKSALVKINDYANKYKHENMESYPEETIKESLRNIFNFTKKTVSYFKGETIDTGFDTEYFEKLIKSLDEQDLKEQTAKNERNKNKELKEKYETLTSERDFLKQKLNKLKNDKDKQNSLIEQYSKDKNLFLNNEETIAELKNELSQIKKNQTEDTSKTIESQNEKINALIEENSRLKNSFENLHERHDEPLLTLQQKIKKQHSLLTAKQEMIDSLKPQAEAKKDDAKDSESVYESYRSSRSAMMFSTSYDEEDVSFSVTHVKDQAKCKSNYGSFYAVVNNVLQRSGTINASRYLHDLDVDMIDLKSIIRFQMTILALVKNNVLNDDEWTINLINGEKRLFEYAMEDIFRRIEFLASLSKTRFTRPSVTVSQNKTVDQNKVNITYDQLLYLNDRVYRIDDMPFKQDGFNMWVSERIDYKIVDSHEERFKEILKELFGHSAFREGQFPILKNILNGNHTIGILPTGGGKSLVYQISGLMQPKMSLVIAPINALIKDQLDKLQNVYGITRVLNITSSNATDKEAHEKRFKEGRALFAFVSPERLQNKYFRNHLIHLGDNKQIGNVVLDEVHCLSEWGHDFRISYLMLSHTLNTYLRGIQYLGLTATASVNVVKDLKVELQIFDDSNIVFSDNLKRENLTFNINEFKDEHSRFRYLKRQLMENYGKATPYDISLNDEKTNAVIVFAKTHDEVEKIEKSFKRYFEDEVAYFHGNYKDSQEAFMKNDRSLLVATKAFGMGVDKPNIRATIHYGPPSSRENFYQEAGRAGRDLHPAECHIYTYDADYYKPYIKEFLSLDTSIKRLKELKGILSFKTDLSTNFFFLAQNIKEPSQESKEVVEHYRTHIYSSKTTKYKMELYTYKTDEPHQSESVLYILHKIGIVENWSKTYKSLNEADLEITIDKRARDIEYIKRKAKEYVFFYDSNTNVVNSIDKQVKGINDLNKLVYAIRRWYHDNFIRARREQLANMYSFVNKYKNKDASDAIQDELEQFFDISSMVDKSDEGYSLLFEDDDLIETVEKAAALDESLIPKRILQMERMLESVTNENIDIYTALIHLRGERFDSRNGRERLISRLKLMEEENIDSFYANILPELYPVLNDNQKLSLLEALDSVKPDHFTTLLLPSIESDAFLKAYSIKYFNNRLKEKIEELKI